MIKTLTKRTYKSNKGRNLVAIVAIIMTTLMFTTLFVLSESMSKSILEMAFKQTGYNTQVSIKYLSDEQIEKIASHPKVKELGKSIVVGLAQNKSLTGNQVEIRYSNESNAKHSYSYPTVGKMPQINTEIALDSITLNRLNIPKEIGQKITLEWIKDFSSGELIETTFTLCGWWEGNESAIASMAWVSESFALDICENIEYYQKGQLAGVRTIQISLYSNKNIKKTMDTILKEIGLTELEYSINLAYDPSMQAMSLEQNLPMYLGMILVFFAGYMIIYNIFQISVASDIQFFGKLKTLGTTTSQIKKIIYGQAFRLCLVGIPIGLSLGYLLGVILVPKFIASDSVEALISFNPIIFIGSATFALLTVFISCLRPARIAAKVSPIEALRYSDAQNGSKKKIKKGTMGASLYNMSLSNLGRNKKRTITVICSLTLGLVLMSGFYAKNASFDIEKYINYTTISDFSIEDATSKDYIKKYNPKGTTISNDLLEKIENLKGLESIGKLYSQQSIVDLSENAMNNIINFFEHNEVLKQMEYNPEYIKDYHNTIETKKANVVLHGIDGIALDSLAIDKHMINGSFDKIKFLSGDYILAVGISTDNPDTYSQAMPTFSVGESVIINGKSFTIMSIVKPYYPVTSGAFSSAYNLDFILPVDTFKELFPDNTLRKLYFNVSDEYIQTTEEFLSSWQKNIDSSMPYTSRYKIEEQFKRETRAGSVMGNTISIVIALVGVLNFLNSMVTAIVSRKKEFAMLQSVGMAKKQLSSMLIFEGLNYAGLTMIFSYILSTLTVGIGIRAMVEGGFTTFKFTLMPLLACTPIIILFAVLTPFFCFKNLEKQSIIERLRNTD